MDIVKNFEGRKDQYLICADQSMRRPGFAVQHFLAKERRAVVIKTSFVNNKYSRKSHGQILSEIARELHSYLKEYPEAILIREEALYGSTKGTIKVVAVLHKVVGISELYAWASNNREFKEVSPKTIKRLVAGNPNAEKEEVAAALEKYVGKWEYTYDDESDAVATGIAWLLQKGWIEKKDG